LERLGWEGENPQRVVVPDDDDDDNDDDDLYCSPKIIRVIR
jgi:hypothetical protein